MSSASAGLPSMSQNHRKLHFGPSVDWLDFYLPKRQKSTENHEPLSTWLSFFKAILNVKICEDWTKEAAKFLEKNTWFSRLRNSKYPSCKALPSGLMTQIFLCLEQCNFGVVSALFTTSHQFLVLVTLSQLNYDAASSFVVRDPNIPTNTFHFLPPNLSCAES